MISKNCWYENTNDDQLRAQGINQLYTSDLGKQ